MILWPPKVLQKKNKHVECDLITFVLTAFFVSSLAGAHTSETGESKATPVAMPGSKGF